MALVVAYLSTYLLLSSSGRYVLINLGGDHWVHVWETPYLVATGHGPLPIRRKGWITPLGFAFLPCVVMDQALRAYLRPQDE